MAVVNNNDVLALELERVIPKIRELYETDDMFYANIENGKGDIGTIGTATVPSVGTDQYVCNTDGFGVRLMRQGQTIQVFDSTLATNRGSAIVTQWDVENQTIQVQPSIAGVTAGDRLV